MKCHSLIVRFWQITWIRDKKNLNICFYLTNKVNYYYSVVQPCYIIVIMIIFLKDQWYNEMSQSGAQYSICLYSTKISTLKSLCITIVCISNEHCYNFKFHMQPQSAAFLFDTISRVATWLSNYTLETSGILKNREYWSNSMINTLHWHIYS